jgi:hypothetical protein
LIILFLFKKLVKTSFIRIELEVISGRKRERAPIIRVRLLKRRRRKVKVEPKLGGQWKEKEKVFCYLFPLFPQATLLKPSFFIL